MKPINIFHLRQQAKKRLPAPIFHYIDGGSDDEWSLRNNTKAFDKYELLPEYLKNIDNIDLTTSLFGKKIELIINNTKLKKKMTSNLKKLCNHESKKAKLVLKQIAK